MKKISALLAMIVATSSLVANALAPDKYVCNGFNDEDVHLHLEVNLSAPFGLPQVRALEGILPLESFLAAYEGSEILAVVKAPLLPPAEFRMRIPSDVAESLPFFEPNLFQTTVTLETLFGTKEYEVDCVAVTTPLAAGRDFSDGVTGTEWMPVWLPFKLP